MDVVPQVVPLALLDTISVSTLAVPVWFLLTPRGLRIRNVAAYLALVGFGYLSLGLLLMSVFPALREVLGSALQSSAGDALATVLGIVLIGYALWYGLRERRDSGEGRLTRWRDAAVGESATWRGVVTVAVLAVGLEIVTMFPYIAALDILSRDGRSPGTHSAILALYCVIMISPALFATAVRALSSRMMDSALRRLNTWLKRNAQENTAWLLGIGGFMVLSNTALFKRGIDFLSQM